MESVPPLKIPNTREYVEVVKSDIRENADKIEFEFSFARRVESTEINDLVNNREGTLWKTVVPRLYKKGWASESGEDAYVLMQISATMGENGKRWIFTYSRAYPDVPLS